MADRDELGRFVDGHAPMGGRPLGSRDRYNIFVEGVSEEDRNAIRAALIEAARNGSLAAIRVFLSYDLGMPHQSTSIDANVATDIEYHEKLAKLYAHP